ncbi:protein kinase [Acinetobacter baumannii]
MLSCFPRYIEGGELIENYVYYFITEWIDGKTLKEKIYDLKDSNIREKLCLFYQVVRALTALLGVEHRDLHPNNIFIIEEKFSEFNRVGFYNNRISPGIKIIDFGEAVYPMSTQFDDSPDFLYDSYFQTGRKIIAAFNYIAPEFYLPILDGKYVRRLNENSDIWSLGIILYLILFNENLFTYADIGTYLQSMNNGEMQQNILEKSKKILELDHPSKYIIYKLFNGIMSVNYKERPDLGDIQIIFWHVINKEIVYSQSETMQLIERPIKFLTEKGEISEPDYD